MSNLSVCRQCMCVAAAVTMMAPMAVHAFVVTITPGTRAIYLQVGTGTVAGGNFNAGGTPQDNTTVNLVSDTVPAASIGGGPRAMTSNSTVAQSPYDGFTFCTPGAQVYVGGFFRRAATGAGGDATLTVTTPPNLVNAASDVIAFNNISWVSSGIGDPTPTIPSGTFVGGLQTLLNVARNTWFESCLAFRYANTQPVAAGVFNGRATYTLTAP